MEKELKPKATETKEGKTQKYTYDELNNICGQLYQQNQNLLKQLRQMDQVAMFKRIDYLLKVVELSDKFKDAEFISNCVMELKEALTLEQPEDNKEKEEAS